MRAADKSVGDDSVRKAGKSIVVEEKTPIYSTFEKISAAVESCVWAGSSDDFIIQFSAVDPMPPESTFLIMLGRGIKIWKKPSTSDVVLLKIKKGTIFTSEKSSRRSAAEWSFSVDTASVTIIATNETMNFEFRTKIGWSAVKWVSSY